MSVARQLTNTEIGTVLSASRKALTGRTFRLASIHGNQGPDVLMGRAGQPKTIRWAALAVEGGTVGGVVPGAATSSRPVESRWRREFTSILDYTGRPASRCGEPAQEGELVVMYELDHATQVWTTQARQRHARDFGGPGITPVFEMLQGAGPMTSGERRRFRERWARAFNSPWAWPGSSPPPLLIGDPMPNVLGEPAASEATQSLWIDTGSFLPLRWEVEEHGQLTRGFDFRYFPIDLRLPAGVDAPGCIR